MPVSVVCESSANVTAALRESLGSAAGTDAKMAAANDSVGDDIQSKLVASAKRVLLSKIEYEEVSNYSQSVLESLKSKYIVLKPSVHNNNSNKDSNNATCGNGGVGSAMNGFIADSNGNNNKQRNSSGGGGGGGNSNGNNSNPNELPQPKRILYPRENVRIGWKSAARKWQVGVGMMNVGNTCYLNSTLQAIFHVPAMANWLLSDTQHMERCESADAGCIICAMAKTLQASQSSQSAIRPYFVYSKLKSICKHLVMGRQEDAHEFLRYLVEAMEKSYLARFRNHKELDQYSKETTPLNQILGGYLKSAVRCLACGHVSVTFQHFQDLLLDIRKADTVEEAMEGYFARERLEDMGYKCEACKKKVSATKQFSLERAPIALCIQLKRFSMLGTKINKQITIKPRLDLTKFAARKSGEQLSYRLVAMVTHLGASQHCGHYTAIGLTESGTYYNYDDSYVRPISVQSVCNTNAYIIFYELDTAPAPVRHVSSTQVSGAAAAAEAKENYQKLNGYAASNNNNNHCKSPATATRLIGPQLPSGALTPSFGINKNSPHVNGNGVNKLGVQRNGNANMPPNSSKIMIHFKNNNSNSNNNAVKCSATSTTTNGIAAASSSSASTASSTTINSNHNNANNINGLHAGTGKFQASAHTQPTLAGTSNKAQTAAAANGYAVFSDEDDDAAVSSTSTAAAAGNVCSSSSSTLPSMPRLFESITTTPKKPTTASPPLLGSAKSSLKSLVPYESETDEDDVADKSTVTTHNSLKRVSASDSDDDDDVKPRVKKPASSTNTTPSQQFKAKREIDAIDEIFNINKKNHTTNNNNYSKTNTTITTTTNTASKKSKSNFFVSSTTSGSNNYHNSSDEDVADLNGDAASTSSAFKRSHSTPPSPPVIKTKTGVWQVTPLQPPNSSSNSTVTTDVTAESPKSKNPKNPFAVIKADTTTGGSKRPKLNGAADKRPMNGYQRDAVSDNVVEELLKQTHRGYGAPVLSWNGTESEIQKEVNEEARQQRRRDWEDEEENDMDRGRQKKVKTPHSSNKDLPLATPGYNPFQEQDNQRRWKNGRFNHGGGGGGGGNNGFGGGTFRRNNHNNNHNNFQRNKFNKRFNYKHQRSQRS